MFEAMAQRVDPGSERRPMQSGGQESAAAVGTCHDGVSRCTPDGAWRGDWGMPSVCG
jgi:hypothetical protein